MSAPVCVLPDYIVYAAVFGVVIAWALLVALYIYGRRAAIVWLTALLSRGAA